MLIDFTAVHSQYLIGSSDRGKWVFAPANPRNPMAGRYLASAQVFSNNALGVAIYLRNEIDDAGAAVAVFTGLKLSFSNKINGRYALNNDPDKVSITLDVAGVRHLYTWLQGGSHSFHHEVVRQGAAPKVINGYRTSGGQFSHTLRIMTTGHSGKPAKVDVGLGVGDVFTLSMYCIGYAKLLFPSIDGGLIDKLLLVPSGEGEAHHAGGVATNLPHAGTSGAGTHLYAPGRPTPADEAAPVLGHGGGAPSPIEIREDTPPTPDLMRAQKAIFAVGVNKWSRRNRSVIEFIQANATAEAMDRMIKAGNRGDFSEWDRLAEKLGT